ncbi:hypothetical protein MY11210_002149 [Beauveria gryllotalpidicola]
MEMGQCGTTGEFCTPSKSPTRAPGTAAPGENGCISNYGTDDRPCLRIAADQINASKYTHAHFSFAVLTDDLSISIISIGGWAFSIDHATYKIFRSAFRSEVNRGKLIDNVVKFLTDNDLDGVDWDWEYPDEPDIPGIPPGTLDDQVGFYLFFQQLRKKMPEGKTVSVTAPASYWYLQHFPIQGISLVVDYIVFMTYDLHGQWDYTNKYSSPGCGSYEQGLGNCLRSHVNLTETINALSMITKADVPSDMIVTEQCTYTGPESGAYKGRYTGTAGYISDFEINEILAHSPSAQTHLDPGSYSDIVVFNNTQWVAHMSPQNKAFHKLLYKGMNFLGTADWAVDLQSQSGEESDEAADSHKTIYVTWHTVLTGGGPIILTSSVQPPPFTVQVTPVIDGTTSIINPTSTSTTTPAAIIWGTKTYVPPVETETKPTPGTTDLVLNSKTPTWKSGKVPEPTAQPDCHGCGRPCLLWCDSDCPFCPPSVFGGGGGGGGSSGGDLDDPDDPDRPYGHHTVMLDGLLSEDVAPATVDPYDVAISVADVQYSWFESVWQDYLFPHQGPETTLSIQPATQTPYARCAISDSFLFWTFSVYDIEGWATDGGKKLHHEENGCGALTGWSWQAETDEESTHVVFNLPFFIKGWLRGAGHCVRGRSRNLVRGGRALSAARWAGSRAGEEGDGVVGDGDAVESRQDGERKGQ